MSEVMDVLNALGTPLKLAWVGWIGWGVGQYFWYRHERSIPVRKTTSVAKPAPKKVAVPKTVAAQAAEAPVVGRLITPSHVTAESRPRTTVVPQPEVHSEPVADAASMPMPASSTAPMPVVVAEQPSAVAQSPNVDPAKAVAGFDPATAVIEQFGVTSDDVLDKFVRDFEMQDARPRRRKTTHVPETPSYGAEAPQLP
jgi:hypothetical protein